MTCPFDMTVAAEVSISINTVIAKVTIYSLIISNSSYFFVLLFIDIVSISIPMIASLLFLSSTKILFQLIIITIALFYPLIVKFTYLTTNSTM